MFYQYMLLNGDMPERAMYFHAFVCNEESADLTRNIFLSNDKKTRNANYALNCD